MKPNFEAINAICPIYAASDRQRPIPIGTGTLLDFGRARFLVTAAHVHDEYTEHTVELYTVGDGVLLQLPQPFQKTNLPASGKRDDDRLDFAFVRLEDSFADKIAKDRFFLPFSLVDANDCLGVGVRYMFTGFPANRDESQFGLKKVRPHRFSFTGGTVTPKRMQELRISPATHIAISFDREQAFDENDVPACFPLPGGMSGGAVWRGDGDFRLWLKETPVRLVGIGIENPSTDGVMIGVRIHLVLLAIAKIYPDLKQYVPMRDGFTAEITVV